jgi:hypothetical protein
MNEQPTAGVVHSTFERGSMRYHPLLVIALFLLGAFLWEPN